MADHTDPSGVPRIPAKQILTRQKSGGWFGSDYNMNLYRGCTHGCIYCDSRSDCYRNPDFDRVYAKDNALGLLERDLGRRIPAGVVATGAMSDPYNPHERTLALTRRALALLAAHGFGVAIDTKSDLVVRDIDLLAEIARRAPVLVKLTITAADDALAAQIEPGAPASSARFEAVRALNAAGLYAGVLMTPILPFVTDTEANLMAIVQKAAAAGARFVYPGLGVTQRAGQREHFHRELDRRFPGMAARYQAAFGGAYLCAVPNARALGRAFARACQAAGLRFRMGDIVDDYKRWPVEQISLF